MTNDEVEKIIRSNMSLQMDLAGIRADFEEKLQRPWVGLTDEEVDQFEIWYDEEEERKGWVEPKLIAQYFEAKLKEKNNV